MDRSRPVPTTLAIHLATPADAPTVHAILAAAGDALAAEGFTNWIPPYPLENVARDVVERAVYLVRATAAGLAPAEVATFMLGPEPHRPYEGMAWAEPDAPALYLNRLAVAPAWHGQGLGSWCLAEIARLTRDAGARAV